ncbi:MAG: AAA family ATPase, partial [Gemmatimonadota bacterium]
MTSSSPHSIGRASEALPPRLPLVGRDGELRALLELLEDGDARPLTVVTGEGGVGKSRLVETVAERARARGWSVVHGRAFPVETGVPYALFSDAFLPLLRAMEQERLSLLSRGGVRELAYLFPGMADDPPDDPIGSDGEELRTRILWNFAEFLRALSEKRPLLVALEDLQWADRSSLQLLHFLVRQVPERGLRYVCSYNENERHRNPALGRVERSLMALRLARVERLEPLSHADTVELVRQAFDVDAEVVSEFCALVYGWTRGNPFFLEQSLKALVDAGKLRRPDGTWLGWEVRELALPRSIRDSVLERMGRLSDDAVTVAEVAAVVGTRARFRLLETIVELPAQRLLAAIEELCDRRILTEETEDGEVVCDFVHPLVRETLYKGFGLARRRFLHGRVAEAMEAHYGSQTMEHADELAFHFARADARHLATKAVRYLAAAGRRALARHADGEAADYLRAAVERLRTPGFEPGGDPHMEEKALLTDLARAHHHRGEYDQARRRWEEALALDLEPDERARIERYGGLARFWSGDPEGALEALDRAERAAREADLPRTEARVRLSRGLCLQETGRAPEAREEIQRALATASELGDRSLLARVHRSLALVNIWTGHPADVYEHARRALEYAEETDHPQVAFWAHWAVAVTRGLGGDTVGM